MKKDIPLPDKIFTVDFAGYHDFNLDGKYKYVPQVEFDPYEDVIRRVAD